MRFKAADKVRVSDYVIRPMVDDMMKWNTGSPQRNQRKEWIVAELRKRGTVLEVFDNGYATGVRVQWDHGPVSETMLHRVAREEIASQYDYLNT